MCKHKFAILALIVITCIGSMSFTGFAQADNNIKNTVISTDISKLTGKGVKIAVIDSGIDIKHPDLKANIVGGYDFVENKPIYKDGDDRTGHGTHVSGIIAATGSVPGVAKEASLLVYRVLIRNDDILEKNIVKAIDAAMKEKVDIINISLKTPVDAPDSDVEKMIKKAVSKGITVVKSNGNYGPNYWTTMDVASSPHVISVANCTLPNKEPVVLGKNGDVVIRLSKVEGSLDFTNLHNVSIMNLGKVTTFDRVKDKLKDKVVIIEHSENCDIISLSEQAKILGVKAIIVTKSKTTEWLPISFIEAEQSVPVATMENSDVQKLNALNNQGVTIRNEEVEEIYSTSSRGPIEGNWILKPDISAPGTNILSTAPLELIGSDKAYRRNTGTSMSAPYITGVVALIKQAHPSWGPQEIKAALANNATVLKNRIGVPYSVLEQGSGKVDIEKALATKAFIMPSNMTFGLIKDFSKNKIIKQTLTIKNISGKSKKYSIRVELKKNIKGLKLEIPSKVMVGANNNQKIDFLLKLDKGITERGILEGRLYFEDGKDVKLVPFIILLSPTDYPLVSSLKVKENLLSPNDDKLFEDTEIAYYLPQSIKNLLIVAENIDTGEIINLFQEKNVKAGTYRRSWYGETITGEKLRDGVYSINIFADNGNWKTTISGNNIITLDTAPPEIKLNVYQPKRALKEIRGLVSDYFIEKSYIVSRINEDTGQAKKPVRLYYYLGNTWNEILLDENGEFSYTFKEDEQEKVKQGFYIKAVDIAGNMTIKRITG